VFLIVKGKNLDLNQLESLEDDIMISTSENGWIDDDIKVEWLEQIVQQMDITKR